MNRLLLTILILLFSSGMWAQESAFRQLSDASMNRIVPAEAFIYNWRDAVLAESFIQIARKDPKMQPVIDEYLLDVAERVSEKAHGHHPNGVASAAIFAYLYGRGLATSKVEEAMNRVYSQYMSILRAENGACSHRHMRVELWDDTLYMVGIFLMELYRATGDRSYLDQCAKEILSHAKHLYDEKTGLWYHGWSESDDPVDDGCCVTGWNANPLHRNSEFWGRGNGWIAMIMVDLLELLPSEDSHYASLLRMYRKMSRSLARLQDRESGMWYQLPIRKDEAGNFLESSATAMFGYSFAKGARLGIIPEQFENKAKKAYFGLIRSCIVNKDAEDITLGNICEGTCIGDKDYYFGRKRIDSETYAVGAFLMLANEIEN